MSKIVLDQIQKNSGTALTWPAADGSADQFMQTDGSGTLSFAVSGITQNTIAGLILSKTASDTLTIAAGSARDTGDAATMVLAAFTKDVSAAWAVGTGNGSLDTGSYATSTTYAVWLIQRSGTAVVDVLTSTSFTGPTMPSNYDRKRLIGYFLTDGTPDIIAFTHSGDYFRLTGAVVTDVDDTTVSAATFETAALSCPPNCLAHIYALAYNPSGSETAGRLFIKTEGASEAADSGHAWMRIGTSGTFDLMTVQGFVLVNSSSQIQYAIETVTSGEQLSVYMFGCMMLTRREP